VLKVWLENKDRGVGRCGVGVSGGWVMNLGMEGVRMCMGMGIGMGRIGKRALQIPSRENGCMSSSQSTMRLIPSRCIHTRIPIRIH